MVRPPMWKTAVFSVPDTEVDPSALRRGGALATATTAPAASIMNAAKAASRCRRTKNHLPQEVNRRLDSTRAPRPTVAMARARPPPEGPGPFEPVADRGSGSGDG